MTDRAEPESTEPYFTAALVVALLVLAIAGWAASRSSGLQTGSAGGGLERQVPAAVTPAQPAADTVETGGAQSTALYVDGDGFDPHSISVSAGVPLLVHLRSGDTRPHRVIFSAGTKAGAATVVDVGESSTSTDVRLGPLAPGVYRFTDDLSQATGRLIVR